MVVWGIRSWIISLSIIFGSILSGCTPVSSPHTATVQVGAGSYATTLPDGEQGPSNRAGEPVVPLVTDAFEGPVPTSDWWTSLLWDYDDEPYSKDLYPHPLAVRAVASGLLIRYPTTANVEANAYFFDRTNDLRVGLVGLEAPDTRVTAYSDWTVTAAWIDQDQRLEATMGHGLPFVYFAADGGVAEVIPQAEAHVWFQTRSMVGLTVNGHHYGLFAPTGVAWTTGDTLRANLGTTPYLSVAVLPDSTLTTLQLFQQHAYAFVVDTQVAWVYDEKQATVTTTYSVETDLKEQGEQVSNVPLLALYRHQWLHTEAPLTAYTYTSPRGTMRVLADTAFQTTLPFGGVLPAIASCPTTDADGTLYELIDDVYRERNVFPGNLGRGDTYWSGKGMGRLAELVPLAEAVGHTAARDRFLETIRTTLEDGLTAGEGTRQFYYDSTWTALIGYPASFGSHTDLNDHHFHYGYHIMAAATVAQYDSGWGAPEAWGGMVDLLIRDANNADRSDTRFPFLSSFDPYAGHAWASGHGGFNDRGNNQESSSESMNYAAALIRWGAETENNAIRDLGIYLYATELSAIEHYWFDIDNAVYPPDFDHTTVAMVWGNGGLYDTWWSPDPEFVHGINYLPFTGASYYLGRHPDYVQANYGEMLRRHEGPPDSWPDLMFAYLALTDAEIAHERFDALRQQGYRPEDGTTVAHVYQWIQGLRGLGRVATDVRADHPLYRVFRHADGMRYVAYNPTDEPLNVTYSDGFTQHVPPNTQAVACP